MNRSPQRSFRLSPRLLGILAVSAAIALPVFGQFFRGGGFGGRYGGGAIYVAPGTRTAREVNGRSTEKPVWSNPKDFQDDVFTFARLEYTRGGAGGGSWTTDLPDADLNLSFRLQQMTSIRVDPDGRLLKATDPELANYPFLFAAAPGAISLNDKEIAALRKYLLNGGCMIMTDFWGQSELQNFENVFRRILPEYPIVELQLDHPLYQSVFKITDKGQVPNINQGEGLENNPTGITYETNHDGDTRTVHHKAIFDDKGRLMVLAIHNSDHSDGWEREGENDYYFHRFSEAIAYPLAINAIVYMMTH